MAQNDKRKKDNLADNGSTEGQSPVEQGSTDDTGSIPSEQGNR